MSKNIYKRLIGGLYNLVTADNVRLMCQELSEFYRWRAPLESLKSSVRFDPSKSTDVIDVTHTRALAIPVTGKKVEFAVDRNGIYFARIEGGKYYPLDISLSIEQLEKAEKYKRIGASWQRRVTSAFRISMEYHLVYPLEKVFGELGDSLFLGVEVPVRMLAEALAETTEALAEAAKETDKVAKEAQGLVEVTKKFTARLEDITKEVEGLIQNQGHCQLK